MNARVDLAASECVRAVSKRKWTLTETRSQSGATTLT